MNGTEERSISVRYSAVDGYSTRKTFTSVREAQ